MKSLREAPSARRTENPLDVAILLMAWLEKHGQKFLLVFRLDGTRYKSLLDLKDRREADAVAA